MKIEFSSGDVEVEIVIGTKGLIVILALGILCRFDVLLAMIETIRKWMTG